MTGLLLLMSMIGNNYHHWQQAGDPLRASGRLPACFSKESRIDTSISRYFVLNGVSMDWRHERRLEMAKTIFIFRSEQHRFLEIHKTE